MANYPGRLVSSFLLYSTSFSVIFAMTIKKGWYLTGGYSYHFSERSSERYAQYNQYLGYGSSSYNYNYNQDFSDNGLGMSTAMHILLFTSLGFTGLCVLLSFIMMCADCCCRITKCMTVIPKITTGFGQVAGILAEAACGVFLVKIYSVAPPKDSQGSTKISVIPYYCFYLVSLAGILLMIAGCINCGVKNATRVQDSSDSGNVELAKGVTQNQGTQQQVMHAGGMAPPGMMPYYPPLQTAFPNQAYYPGNSSYPPKVFLTHMFTQTSQTDLKKDSNS